MSDEAPSVEDAVAALEERIDAAVEAGHTMLAAECGVLLGYVMGANGHPRALERAQRAARVLERGDELDRPLRLAQSWGR